MDHNTVDPSNPYAQQSVASAAPAERMLFLRKTYSLVLLGITLFAVAMLSYGKVESLTNLSNSFYTSGRWVPLIVMLGGGFLVRMLARVRVIGFVGFLAWSGALGLMVAPLAAIAGPSTTGTAAVVTLGIFLGLTAYVFITKQDFSWMGGALTIVLFLMIGIGVASMIWGFELGSWYSIIGALLFSGYILYDTSDVMRRSSVEDAVPAAIELTTDVIMLFWNLLMIFTDRD